MIGIALGVLFSYALSWFLGSIGYAIDLSFTARSLLLGAVFSMVVGLVFGLSPAFRAAKLTPMEALRRD